MKLLLCLFVALPAFGLPLYRDSLDNGLIIVTYEDHRVPAVTMRLVSRSGATHDPAGRSGTANLTARLLLDGTADRRPDEVTEVVEFHGMRREAGAGADFSWVGLQALAEHLDTALALLTDATRSAAFPADEFERERATVLAAARRAWDRPAYAVMDEFDRLFFGDHPYRRDPSGDTIDLPRVTPADLRAFHARHWRPGNCFLIVVGAVERENLLALIRTRLSDWPVGDPVSPVTGGLPEFPTGIRARVITRPELNQSYVAMGHPGLAMSDPDLLAARLMSYVLGGSAIASRLGESVRVEGGLAYDVRCWYDRLALPGAFRATVQTSNPSQAIRRMRDEFRLMHDSGPTQRETESARNYYTGSFPLGYSDTRGKLRELTTAEVYRLGPGWLAEFPHHVSALNRGDLASVARTRLRPDDLLIVILGPVTPDELGLEGVTRLD